MKKQKRQRIFMALMAGLMVVALILPMVVNIFIR